ncbi:hypothetical protein CPAR01_07900 [Colletotrichum paranaense]|uniref:Uncharacterized protein n=1 Tax=Colletotrichum paranaense TaxID=1914294 RepID=A0ABQ9SIR4_9PEZI|nr:uncharacterized protein CPAR01_07900 [Colletotrichum paranaense]KAK1537787.1 hypothetical protein CPAR01_07900 [Colletotrichum paranaense]
MWGKEQGRTEIRTVRSGYGPRCLILTVSWVGTYLLPLSLSGKSSKTLHFFAHTHNLNHPGTNTPVYLGSSQSLALFLCYYTLKIQRRIRTNTGSQCPSLIAGVFSRLGAAPAGDSQSVNPSILEFRPIIDYLIITPLQTRPSIFPSRPALMASWASRHLSTSKRIDQPFPSRPSRRAPSDASKPHIVYRSGHCRVFHVCPPFQAVASSQAHQGQADNGSQKNEQKSSEPSRAPTLGLAGNSVPQNTGRRGVGSLHTSADPQ